MSNVHFMLSSSLYLSSFYPYASTYSAKPLETWRTCSARPWCRNLKFDVYVYKACPKTVVEINDWAFQCSSQKATSNFRSSMELLNQGYKFVGLRVFTIYYPNNSSVMPSKAWFSVESHKWDIDHTNISTLLN